MEDPRKLRELAGWYREFAERAGNPAPGISPASAARNASQRGTTSRPSSASTSSTRSRRRPSKKGNGASANRDLKLTI